MSLPCAHVILVTGLETLEWIELQVLLAIGCPFIFSTIALMNILTIVISLVLKGCIIHDIVGQILISSIKCHTESIYQGGLIICLTEPKAVVTILWYAPIGDKIE